MLRDLDALSKASHPFQSACNDRKTKCTQNQKELLFEVVQNTNEFISIAGMHSQSVEENSSSQSIRMELKVLSPYKKSFVK